MTTKEQRELEWELKCLYRMIGDVPVSNFSPEDLSILKRMKTLYHKLNKGDWETCWLGIYEQNLRDNDLLDEDVEEYNFYEDN